MKSAWARFNNRYGRSFSTAANASLPDTHQDQIRLFALEALPCSVIEPPSASFNATNGSRLI